MKAREARNLAHSEANVKTDKMVNMNGPIANNGVLPVTVYFFENFVSV